MSPRYARFCGGLLLLLGVLLDPLFAQNKAPSKLATPTDIMIQIDASKIANYRIPRSIFGSFLEPIGNSIMRLTMTVSPSYPLFGVNDYSPVSLFPVAILRLCSNESFRPIAHDSDIHPRPLAHACHEVAR